jgi:hypothetical protein
MSRGDLLHHMVAVHSTAGELKRRREKLVPGV